MLSASVEVAPVFGVNLSNPSLVFPEVSPGKTHILGEGHYYNEVVCLSNNGRPWYLKAQLISLKHLQQNYRLPPQQLKLKVWEAVGEGEIVKGRNQFDPFSNEPMTIYIGRGRDAEGAKVIVRFQYSLTCPPDAPAGSYVGQIIFTMAESP